MPFFDWLQRAMRLPDEATQRAQQAEADARKVDTLFAWLRGTDYIQQKLASETLRQVCYSWEGIHAPSFVVLVMQELNRGEWVRYLPYVRELVHRGARTAEQKTVLAAARDCLEALERAERRMKEGETLLRPSEAGAQGGAELLRPAEGQETLDPGDLLRPSAPETPG